LPVSQGQDSGCSIEAAKTKRFELVIDCDSICSCIGRLALPTSHLTIQQLAIWPSTPPREDDHISWLGKQIRSPSSHEETKGYIVYPLQFLTKTQTLQKFRPGKNPIIAANICQVIKGCQSAQKVTSNKLCLAVHRKKWYFWGIFRNL